MAPSPLSFRPPPIVDGRRELEANLKGSPPMSEGPQVELWRLIGDSLGHVLEHLETVKPRHGDVDLAHNSVEAQRMDASLTLQPNGAFSAVNNTPKEYRFVARPGWVAHITAVTVAPLNPTQSMANVAVLVELNGRIVQRVPALSFVRPIMLDRDDVLRLLVSNTSGGDLPLQYTLSGWLRPNKE